MVILSSGGEPIWASDTHFGVDLAPPNEISGSQTLAVSLRMQQSDGDLVLYDAANHPIWSTGPNHDPGAFFYLQSNGTMTLG